MGYVEKAGGIDTSQDYPDKSHNSGKTGKCKWDKKEVVKVTGYKYAVPPCDSGSCKNQNEDTLAAALAKFGPISICVNAENWILTSVVSTPRSVLPKQAPWII